MLDSRVRIKQLAAYCANFLVSFNSLQAVRDAVVNQDYVIIQEQDMIAFCHACKEVAALCKAVRHLAYAVRQLYVRSEEGVKAA